MDLNSILIFIAEATEVAEKGAAKGNSSWAMPLMMVFMVGAFYLMFIRPQNRKQKEHQSMVSSLKAGDKVVTIGGIYGTVHNVKKESVVLKVDEKSKMEMTIGSISKVLKDEENKDKK